MYCKFQGHRRREKKHEFWIQNRSIARPIPPELCLGVFQAVNGNSSQLHVENEIELVVMRSPLCLLLEDRYDGRHPLSDGSSRSCPV